MKKTVVDNYNTEHSGPFLVKIVTALNELEIYRHTHIDHLFLEKLLLNQDIEKYSVQLDDDPTWD